MSIKIEETIINESDTFRVEYHKSEDEISVFNKKEDQHIIMLEKSAQSFEIAQLINEIQRKEAGTSSDDLQLELFEIGEKLQTLYNYISHKEGDADTYALESIKKMKTMLGDIMTKESHAHN